MVEKNHKGLEENKTANLEFYTCQKYPLKIKARKYVFRETKTREICHQQIHNKDDTKKTFFRMTENETR